MQELKINDYIINNDSPTFIIAEISANHSHDFNKTLKMLKQVKTCGADAVKVQTYTPDTITIDCDNEYFQINQGTLWDGTTLYKLYQEAYMPWDWQPKLKKVAEDMGLVFFSTPFDFTAVDFLEDMNVPVYKIASFEINDIPLIRYIAQKQKPIIISTGISEINDIELAVNTIRGQGNNQISLLKCTSSYPAQPEEANLRTILDLKERFDVIPGLSDHTLGVALPIAAVTLGAKIIEKHFTLSRIEPGPDSPFSLEPDEFKNMVDAIRVAEKSLGKVTYKLSEQVKKNRKFSRSLFVVKDIKKGEQFTPENVRSIRPGNGLHTKHYDEILGQYAKDSYLKGTPLTWEMIEKK